MRLIDEILKRLRSSSGEKEPIFDIGDKVRIEVEETKLEDGDPVINFNLWEYDYIHARVSSYNRSHVVVDNIEEEPSMRSQAIPTEMAESIEVVNETSE